MTENFCPACNQDVEYKIQGGQSYCSICGRTQGVAEESVKVARKESIQKKVKLGLKTIGFLSLGGLVILGLLLNPERIIDQFVSVGKGMAILVIPGAILTYWMYKRKKKASNVKGETNLESEGVDTKLETDKNAIWSRIDKHKLLRVVQVTWVLFIVFTTEYDDFPVEVEIFAPFYGNGFLVNVYVNGFVMLLVMALPFVTDLISWLKKSSR
jgi:hypothetical protein